MIQRDPSSQAPQDDRKGKFLIKGFNRKNIMTPILIEELIVVTIGGGIGAVSRFLLSYWIQGQLEKSSFPWGILTVNILGCFLMGVLFGLFLDRLAVSPLIRSGLMIGVLGGFTTFSSFSMDMITLLQSGIYSAAFAYLFATMFGCLLATALGLMLVRVIV